MLQSPLLGHGRKPFIRIALQEHNLFQILAKADLSTGRNQRKPYDTTDWCGYLLYAARHHHHH